jgi:hypothetical protein
MDFIIGLPKSVNKSDIMVVVDRLSKYAHLCALQHPIYTNRYNKRCTSMMYILMYTHVESCCMKCIIIAPLLHHISSLLG